MPLVAPNPHKFEAGDETPLEDTWDWWNRFVDQSYKLQLSIEKTSIFKEVKIFSFSRWKCVCWVVLPKLHIYVIGFV